MDLAKFLHFLSQVVELTKGSQEEQFAKNSLFARHPQMRDWPSFHGE